MRRTQTEGNPLHFTVNELSTDRERRKFPHHVYTGRKQAKISPYTSTQRVERPLRFAEYEAEQPCILEVYLIFLFWLECPSVSGRLIFVASTIH